jgi:hypothetical protein
MNEVDKFVLELQDLLRKHKMKIRSRGGAYGSSSVVIVDKDGRDHDYYEATLRGLELRGDL